MRGAHYRQDDVRIKQFRHFARTWGDWILALLKTCCSYVRTICKDPLMNSIALQSHSWNLKKPGTEEEQKLTFP